MDEQHLAAMNMIEAILNNPAAMGVLTDVTYSLSLDEPPLIREIGLHFSAAGVVFSAANNRLLVKRGRVCVPGLCREDENCVDASQSPRWRPVLNASLVQVDCIEPAATHGAGIRLTFDAKTSGRAVEIGPEASHLCLSDMNGANAWGSSTADRN